MRAAAVVILLSAGLVLAACGSETSRLGRPPRLPKTLAEQLAVESDALAAALARNDACAARTRFHRLEHRTRDAISARAVPVALRTELLGAVRRLGGRLPACTPPPPPARPRPRDEQKDGGKSEDRPGKKKGGKTHGHGKSAEKHGKKGR